MVLLITCVLNSQRLTLVVYHNTKELQLLTQVMDNIL